MPMRNFWLDLIAAEKYAEGLNNYFNGKEYFSWEALSKDWDDWFKQRDADYYSHCVRVGATTTPVGTWYVINVYADKTLHGWEMRSRK